jgi:uncharacterized protein (TIGR03067 family)
MFRKTFICVAGVVAGVSAGAYSSGFFNEENAVTTLYNQTLERMGLETQNSDSVSNSMTGDMGIASEASSLVSASIDDATVASPSETASTLDDTSPSDSGNLAQELLAANGISRSSKPKPSEVKEADVEAKVNEEKKADVANKEATDKRTELDARQTEEARLETELKQAQALVEKRFSEEVYKSSTGQKLNYRKLTPNESQQDKLHPLVVFLHGKGERGNDNRSQLKHGLKLLAADEGMRRFPAIVIAPQCPADQLWTTTLEQKDTTPRMAPAPTPSMRLVLELIDSMLLTDSIDPNRVYVTGLSMGGFGTFDLIARRPALFAAAAPLCGGGDPSPAKIKGLLNMPMWVVHGTDDNVVNINRSREMVYALEAAGAKPRYSELAGFGHNIWDAAYGDIELYKWMFSQKRAGGEKDTNKKATDIVAGTSKSKVASPAAPAIAVAKKPVNPKTAPTASKKPVTEAEQPSTVEPKAKPLLGQWKVLAASQKGKQADKKALDKMSVTFKSDEFVIQIGDRQEVAKFKLSNSEKTQQIDIISNRKGVESSAGIYELNGDKMIICWGEPGRPRPTRFVNFMNVKSLVLQKQ